MMYITSRSDSHYIQERKSHLFPWRAQKVDTYTWHQRCRRQAWDCDQCCQMTEKYLMHII